MLHRKRRARPVHPPSINPRMHPPIIRPNMHASTRPAVLSRSLTPTYTAYFGQGRERLPTAAPLRKAPATKAKQAQLWAHNPHLGAGSPDQGKGGGGGRNIPRHPLPSHAHSLPSFPTPLRAPSVCGATFWATINHPLPPPPSGGGTQRQAYLTKFQSQSNNIPGTAAMANNKIQ